MPGQAVARRLLQFFLTIALYAIATAGCNREGTGDAGHGATSTQSGAIPAPTVASLVPAATDLVIGMGAGRHLVAVSNYDGKANGVEGLPKVGDYEAIDWERIGSLHPDLMITQFADDRMPEGLRQRQAELKIRSLNVHINRLEDIFSAYGALGTALNESAKAGLAIANLHARLDTLAAKTRSQPRISVLIVIDATGLQLAGPGTFLDDLLPYAGGTNAAASMKNDYPSIDQELLHELDPEVIVQLLPDAVPQVVAEARRVWATMPDLKAVKGGRVRLLTDWYLIQPGAHVADVAEKLSAAIHSAASPLTRAAP